MMRYICYAVPWYATADKKLSSTALRLRLAMESQPPLSVPEMAKLINSLSYLDNARPAFLRNVLTRGRMEYDRYYYAHKAAFEFNGPQHYRTTQRYPDATELAKQQARDNMKAGISVRQGMTLVEISVENLSFAQIMLKAPANLPRRYVNPEGPLIQTVTSLCEEYISYWISAKSAEGDAGGKDEG